MHRLTRSTAGGFYIAPRWPYRSVMLSDGALTRLEDAQRRVAPLGIRLVLTRGYEQRGALNWLHGAARGGGAWCFRLVYPGRAGESGEIFTPNGHDHGGDAIDISIIHAGKRLSLLPWGVFTPYTVLSARRRRYETVLTAVWAALTEAGFAVHANPTEALQIHCEVRVGVRAPKPAASSAATSP